MWKNAQKNDESMHLIGKFIPKTLKYKQLLNAYHRDWRMKHCLEDGFNLFSLIINIVNFEQK